MHLSFKSTLLVAALLVSQVPLAARAADISLYLHGNDRLDYPPQSQSLAMEEMDVWERIRKGFGIPDLDNPLVISQTNWYSARPDYIQRTTTRASRYLYHVVVELEKRNMPTELALLPFIESAFNPQAYSTAKAAGMWQFIPSTGRDFDLKQTQFKDERRDVLASTDAALTYLQRLYGMFGDWQLALAAYNWGEGSVQRAIKKNTAAGLPTDFNGLSRIMPAETQNYVPKLQAVKNIIASPEQYGISLPRVDNVPYFVTIGKTRDIDIKLAAQLAELSLEEFKALNPQYNRPIIIGSVDTQILLPKNNAAKFKENLANWSKTLSSWTAHKVTGARERIDAIAHRFGTTPQVIREVNNIPPKMALKAGSTILVPKTELTSQKDISAEVADNATMQVVPDVPETRRIYVKVGKRDTLTSLASRHKVSVAQIREWNDLKGDKVASGKRLELHVPNRVAARSGAGEKRQLARGERTRAVKTASNRKAAPAAKPRAVANKKSTTKTARKSNRPVKVASAK
ncbi:transglycosylase SLT domain-containing protein [Noviherbaspirillum sedimenti]|uniref:LysM peptidoglycan-binding domain-containing protein n=1 Tax=Noviherbaspirillum sedimenti TaxID=2320865 RepID=A0A3A3G1I2_9BURK|nr:transglycosylase SLT domain-containing protein [Noviherbaspirillum sedimenti]RJG01505.1 LysM peptidoglycan-binding domain-containing protein [Noviherbaspirillum sedimenti]